MSFDFKEDLQPQVASPHKSSGKWFVLAILGGVGLLCVVACCGGSIWFVNFGMSIVSADIESQLRDHPQVRQYVGEIQSLEVNWAKSMVEGGDDTFVYEVVGTDGSGELTVDSISNDEGGEDIISAKLRLSNGETIQLTID